ncbi:MAG: acyl-CoA dehydrogenase family protein [Sphingobium sp.]
MSTVLSPSGAGIEQPAGSGATQQGGAGQSAAGGGRPGDPEQAERLLAFVRDMVPTLRARAAQAEELCRVPPETVQEFHDAGLFRMSIPVEYGGYALTPTQQYAIFAEIARGCASTAWFVWVTSGGTLTMTIYDRAFQDEAFRTPWVGPLNSGVANGAGPGVARRVEGGYMIKGRWPFCSGCHYTAFHHLGAICRDGDAPVSIVCMVPHDQIAILDDWKVMGMRGSGSNTVVIEEEVFVPDNRVRTDFDIVMMSRLQPPREGLLFKVNLLLFAGATMSAIALGAARAAIELFREKIRTRGITNSNYPKQAEAPITHIQLGELHCKLLTAELVARNILTRVEALAEQDLPVDELELTRTTLEKAYINTLSSEITDLTLRASGASSIHENSPFQRLFRDARIPSVHGQSTIETCLEHFGRASVGMHASDAVTRI